MLRNNFRIRGTEQSQEIARLERLSQTYVSQKTQTNTVISLTTSFARRNDQHKTGNGKFKKF